jgi:UDP-N-acetylglucosamine 2-epimerase (non-hydrolysing)
MSAPTAGQPGGRIAVVIGTRAQLIKMAPLMRLLQDRGIAYRFIHTAQHRESLEEILEDFGVKSPDYVLFEWDDEARTLARFGGWLLRAGALLLRDRRRILPGRGGIVLTHGDTTSTIWGAALGRLTGNRVMHVESGLRSHRLLQPFPEEINRLVTFWLSDVYACPNDWALANLDRFRGVKLNTGANTLTDAVRMALEAGDGGTPGEDAGEYAVASVHRFENLFPRGRLAKVVEILEAVAESLPVRFLLHPPTRRQLDALGLRQRLDRNPRIETGPRLGFFAFHELVSRAAFVITDGGSNQEELSYTGKPALLLRDVTERIEGLGRNVVVCGLDLERARAFASSYERYRQPPQSLDIRPSERIVEWLVAQGYAS